MSCAQHLRDLLAPLGVYQWEGSFQWAELRSQGTALDQAAEELENIQREMNLVTARGEGLDAVRTLLVRPPAAENAEQMGKALAALLRIGGDSFTVAAMNDTLRGCGVPALVRETGKAMTVEVSFPETIGIPEDFPETKQIIETILPCHLEILYHFHFMLWTELEAQFLSWTALENRRLNWETFEKQVL